MALYGKNGKPLDKSYLEKNLPKYLDHDIKAYVKGLAEHSSLLDCLRGELYGSINSAEWDEEINHEQANYLRQKYLYGLEE
jgi:hypothetical protein